MDRVALITGGAGGLGRACVDAFLDDGWRVAVPTHRSADGLREAAARHGDRLTWFDADLTAEEGATRAVERTLEWGGRLDAVVHTVGGYAGSGPLHEAPVAEWDRMMDVNLRSAYLVARAALPRMGEGGSLVFVSSRAALRGRKGHAAYAVSKAALLTLVEAIAERAEGPRAGQRRAPGHHRHTREPRVHAGREARDVDAAGRDRAGDPVPGLARLRARERRRRSG